MTAADSTREDPRSIFKRLAVLAAPVVGLNTLNVLALTIDTVMCGYLPDADLALAALGFSTQLVFLLLVATFGLVVGTVALVARAHGRGDEEEVRRVMAQSILLALGIGAGVATIGNLVAPYLLDLLGASPEVAALGVAYLRPLLTLSAFSYLGILLAGVLRGVGNTQLPFRIALAATALNVFLNYGFIHGNLGFPPLGVAGASWGTVSSQIFTLVCLVFFIRRGAVPGLVFPWRLARPDRKRFGLLVQIGWPAAADVLLINLTFLSMIFMLSTFDQSAVAAHALGLRVQALAYIPGFSIAQATAAMTGQALGAGSEARARAVARSSMVLCTAVMSVLALTIVAGASSIVTVFDVDPTTELGLYAVLWMQVLGYMMPIVGPNVALNGVLQGAGATKLALKINVLVTLLQIPLAVFLGFGIDWGVFGVWVSFPLTFGLRVGMMALIYRGRAWLQTPAAA